MKLYNTLTKQKEEFKPLIGNEVRVYSCGPTVYGYAHIGNMRTYIFSDIVRKTLKYNGFQVKQVINITDVGHLTDDSDDGEEKMISTARAENKTPYEIAEYYTNVFLIDMKKLNIELPELMPKATDHIKEMIDYVAGLIDKGYAYETSDGIYFEVKKFADYGALSNIDLDAQLAGARVDVNEEKRYPADFALWKKAPKEHIMQWSSPWGMGYPGWHIECSAMSLKYLGEVFDIHTGGVDHIPIHHENEIAQSNAYLGKQAVKIWMHGEFLLVNNGKMAKSLGTTFRVSDLEAKGYAPLDYRYFCLNANYRNKLNFTWEAIESAKISYQRLLEEAAMHKYGIDDLDESIVDNFKNQFDDAVNDDLNIPKALGTVWNAVRYPVKSKKIFAFLLEADKILSIDIQKAEIKSNEDKSDQISDEIKALVEKRQEARKAKDFKASDEIRDRLKEMGVVIEDTKDGQKIRFEKE